MFSPVDPILIAAAGGGGTRLFDIRRNRIKYKFIKLVEQYFAEFLNFNLTSFVS